MQLVYECVLLVELPVEVFRMVPHSVKPYCSYLAVVGQYLGELCVHEVEVRVPVGGAFGLGQGLACIAERIVRAIPVHVRVVNVQLYALSVTFVGQLFQYVAPERGGVNDVVVGGFRVEH